MHDYWARPYGYDITQPVEARPVFVWAAFAYTEMRSIDGVHITSIKDSNESPFHFSLSFVHTADGKLLGEWMANQEFKRLKAKDTGRFSRVKQLNRSVREIESVITQIIAHRPADVSQGADHCIEPQPL